MSVRVPARSRRRTQAKGLSRPSWLLVVPAATVYALIVLYPSLRDFVEAFTNWNGIDRTHTFVGLDNFRALRDDPRLGPALWNTAIIAVVVTIFQNGLGLLAALAINSRLKTRASLRVLLFLPVVVNPIVVAYIWQFMYATGGPVDEALRVTHLEALRQNWLGDPSIALGAALAPMVWQFVGFSMVIFLAGLQGIPKEVVEASELDGAGGLRQFRHITWPLLAPALTINAVLTVIGGLNAFAVIYALTGGGPGTATETVTTVLFREAFFYGRYGYGTAMALALSIGVALVVYVQLKVLRGREFAA